MLNLYNISAIFCILIVCLCFICLLKSMCWQSVSHNTHGPLWNTVAIYIFLILEGFLDILHNTSTFLWLRLRYIKAHGDLGAPSLSYFKKNKNELNIQVRYDEIFLYFVFVLMEVFSWFFCLGKFVCVVYSWFGVSLALSCLWNYGHD